MYRSLHDSHKYRGYKCFHRDFHTRKRREGKRRRGEDCRSWKGAENNYLYEFVMGKRWRRRGCIRGWWRAQSGFHPGEWRSPVIIGAKGRPRTCVSERDRARDAKPGLIRFSTSATERAGQTYDFGGRPNGWIITEAGAGISWHRATTQRLARNVINSRDA